MHDVIEAAAEQPGSTLAAATATPSPDQRSRLYEDLAVPEAWALRGPGHA
ncbi:hypothetical protein ACH4VT_12815 [Streptomyces lydicus]